MLGVLHVLVRPTREFFTHMETWHHYQWSAANLELPIAMSTEGSLPYNTYCDIHLLWSSPKTHDTHTCCRKFGNGAVATYFYGLVYRDRWLNPDHPHTRRILYQLSHRGGWDFPLFFFIHTLIFQSVGTPSLLSSILRTMISSCIFFY